MKCSHSERNGSFFMKKCSRCKIEKTIDKFRKASAGKLGVRGDCKQCASTHEKMNGKKYRLMHKTTIKRNQKLWRDSNQAHIKRYVRNHNYKKRYNLTYDDIVILCKKQNKKCIICSKPMFITDQRRSNGMVVDHNHKTGQMRGLICRNCNSGLGLFQDNYLLLLQAATYLQNTPLTNILISDKVVNNNS